jgi:N-acetyl-alpha-D-muramate 1-phosphate uridylyltransferase
MKAMIFAAGRGERMGELTRNTPKPLLPVGEQRLIEYHLYRLAALGVSECIINTYYLAEQFLQVLGDGSRYGLRITYSHETEKLDTGGGIINALDFFDDKPFLLVNGDVFTDYPFEKLINKKLNSLAHLVLVDNPDHHPQGDFVLQEDSFLALSKGQKKLTYAGIALLSPKLVSSYPKGLLSFGNVLMSAIAKGQVTGEYFGGRWLNVDTPKRLLVAKACVKSYLLY